MKLCKVFLEMELIRNLVDGTSLNPWTKMNIAHPIPSTLHFQGSLDATKQSTYKMESIVTASGFTDITTRLIAWSSACYALIVCFHSQNLEMSPT